MSASRSTNRFLISRSPAVLIWLAALAALGGQANKPQRAPNVVAFGADPTGVRDSTVAIQAALDAFPNARILFPAQPNGAAAVYKTTTIRVLRSQVLQGEERSSSRLLCTSSSLPCVLFGDTIGTGDHSISNGGISDMTLSGPGGATSIGLFLGGDPSGRFAPAGNFANALSFYNLRVQNFHNGIQFGNNAFLDSFFSALIANNGNGVYIPSGVTNTGEAVSFYGGAMGNGSIGICNLAGAQIFVFGMSFDYNGNAVKMFGGQLTAAGVHFEQNGGPFVFVPYGYPTLVFTGCDFLYNAGTGADENMLDLWPQSMMLVVNGVTAYSNHPVKRFVHLPTTDGQQIDLRNLKMNSKIAAVSNQVNLPGGLQMQTSASRNMSIGCDQSQADGQVTICGQDPSSPTASLSVKGGVSIAGTLRLAPTSTTPQCTAQTRGTFLFVSSPVGSADHLKVCSKLATDAYSWVTVY